MIPIEVLPGSWFGILKPLVPSFKPFEKDPIKLEADRLGVKFPMFGWSLGGVVKDDSDIRGIQEGDKIGAELTPYERDQRLQLYGNLLRHEKYGVQALMNNPNYKDRPEGYSAASWNIHQRKMYEGLVRDHWDTDRKSVV